MVCGWLPLSKPPNPPPKPRGLATDAGCAVAVGCVGVTCLGAVENGLAVPSCADVEGFARVGAPKSEVVWATPLLELATLAPKLGALAAAGAGGACAGAGAGAAFVGAGSGRGGSGGGAGGISTFFARRAWSLARSAASCSSRRMRSSSFRFSSRRRFLSSACRYSRYTRSASSRTRSCSLFAASIKSL